MKHNFCFLLFFIGISLVLTADKTTTIFVVGDSTAANKDTSGGKLERGWGQMLQNFFNQNFVVVDNHALNGRSSKSFVDEGHWAEVTKLIKKGDYVLIQFGHNDEKEDEARHTDPGSTFDQYLSKYATETIALGGIPVLMSPVVRRNWKNGNFVNEHVKYVQSCKNVASKLNISYIDAKAITAKIVKDMGENGSKKLYMISQGKNDNTHFCIYGATLVAKALAQAIAKEVPILGKYKKIKKNIN